MGRRTSVWLPGAGAAVAIAPAPIDAIATLPSISTSTGVVNALTMRSDGWPVVQQSGSVGSLLHPMMNHAHNNAVADNRMNHFAVEETPDDAAIRIVTG